MTRRRRFGGDFSAADVCVFVSLQRNERSDDRSGIGSDYHFARPQTQGLDGAHGRTANVIPRTIQVVRCNLSAGNRIESGRLDGSLKVKTRAAM